MILRSNFEIPKTLSYKVSYNPPKLLNTFWIITGLLQAAAANFLRSLKFLQLYLLLRLGVGHRGLSIFSLSLPKLIRHFSPCSFQGQ